MLHVSRLKELWLVGPDSTIPHNKANKVFSEKKVISVLKITAYYFVVK